jgi:hypothetical protein
VIEYGITIRTNFGKGFTQLLYHPLCGRMTSHVEVQNPAAAMLDYEETIQDLEGQRGPRLPHSRQRRLRSIPSVCKSCRNPRKKVLELQDGRGLVRMDSYCLCDAVAVRAGYARESAIVAQLVPAAEIH